MKETRNSIKAQVSLMVGLATAAKKVGDDICKAFGDVVDDRLFDLLNEIQDVESTNVEEIMKELESYFIEEGTEEGEPIAIPYVTVDHCGSMETGVTYPDGSRLAGFLSTSDDGTWQSGAIAYTKENSPVDLCMAEIKKGNIAKTAKLSPDNKDVDIYAWSDAYNENHTHHFRVANKDILEALNECEEGGENNE